MKHSVHFIFVFLTICGCQGRTSWRSDGRLGERLAAIEQSRLSVGDSARPVLSAGAASGKGTDWWNGGVSELRRDGRVARAGARGWGDSVAVLSLGDLGEADEDYEFELASERESNYLRRPPLDSFWDTVKRDVRHMPGDLWRDTKLVYTNPVNLVILGTAYAGSLTLQQTGVDNTVERNFKKGKHHFKKDWRDGFAAAGNPGTHFALAGAWYLIGQQSMDDKTYDVGKTMFSALIINGLTVLVGQAATWDRGPNGETGTFPSGHTSSSFVMASVLHRAYGHAVGIPLYGLATLVAVERIDSGEHYFADVVMGGVLGAVIGHAVAGGRDPEFYGWKIVPYASPHSGGSGIALMKTFK
ncbi:MAG: phosphatase PAP2 family protein [Planctomycetota bacterium]|nr:phosphatase PAP2 family protein [Planctomycetota bacterium]